MKTWYEIYTKVGKNLSMSLDKADTLEEAQSIKSNLRRFTKDKLFIDQCKEIDGKVVHQSQCREASSDEVILHIHNSARNRSIYDVVEDIIYS